MNVPPNRDERKRRSIDAPRRSKSARMIAPRDGTSVAISKTCEAVFSCLADDRAAAVCARTSEPRRRRVDAGAPRTTCPR